MNIQCNAPTVDQLTSGRMDIEKGNKIISVQIAVGSLLMTTDPIKGTAMRLGENASRCMSTAWDFVALNESKVYITPR